MIAFDGKTLRGARDAAGNLVHLLAGLCQTTGTVLAQIAVGTKTNEIPMLRKLLDEFGNITDAVITADALHCQRDTAEAIVGRWRSLHPHRESQPAQAAKDAQRTPWKHIPVLDQTSEHGHGRTAKRTLNACEITGASASPTRPRCCN